VRPDLIVVSAGYDFAAGDPVGDLGVDATVASAALANLIAEVAATYSRGRIVYSLEGGYDVETLATAVETTIRTSDAASTDARAADSAIPAPQRVVLDAIDTWRT
jgi:acetoin utilization deacetylase AcuC-like enzyme